MSSQLGLPVTGPPIRILGSTDLAAREVISNNLK